MNSVSGLYQCQCPGCDIILEFCKVLRETELKILAVLFIIVVCISTIISIKNSIENGLVI